MNPDKSYSTLFVISFLLLVGCTSGDNTAQQQQWIDEIRAVETAFCARTQKVGMASAFLEYADSQVIKMDDGFLATRGRQALVETWAGRAPSGPTPLMWEPQHIEVAKSGDIAWSFGYWQYTTPLPSGRDTLYFGNYVNIWKHQPDGTWKYMLDTGTDTPQPPGWP